MNGAVIAALAMILPLAGCAAPQLEDSPASPAAPFRFTLDREVAAPFGMQVDVVLARAGTCTFTSESSGEVMAATAWTDVDGHGSSSSGADRWLVYVAGQGQSLDAFGSAGNSWPLRVEKSVQYGIWVDPGADTYHLHLTVECPPASQVSWSQVGKALAFVDNSMAATAGIHVPEETTHTMISSSIQGRASLVTEHPGRLHLASHVWSEEPPVHRQGSFKLAMAPATLSWDLANQFRDRVDVAAGPIEFALDFVHVGPYGQVAGSFVELIPVDGIEHL